MHDSAFSLFHNGWDEPTACFLSFPSTGGATSAENVDTNGPNEDRGGRVKAKQDPFLMSADKLMTQNK
jgi:hypothetical protein